MQYSGTLIESDVASLLKTVMTERATGTLVVAHGAESASLYFLFGHLLHAAGAEGDGEQVVLDALQWTDGNYEFDPRAKLPFEETIKATTADLIEEAERRRHEAGPEAASSPADAAASAAVRDPAGDVAQAAQEPASDHAAQEPAPAQAAHEHAPAQAAQERAPARAGHEPAPPAGPPQADARVASGRRAPSTKTGGVAAQGGQPGAHPTAEAGEEASLPSSAGTAPGPYPAQDELPQVMHRRFSDPAPLGDMFPLPTGRPVYERLKSAIVFFPKLMSTLKADRETGYLRLVGADFQGLLLLHDGHLLEALYKAKQLSNRTHAFNAIRRRMEAGDGSIDLIELSGETVIALGQLLMARPMYTGLLGRFVQFQQLLDHLSEEKTDGSIVVQGTGDTGVILLRRGQVLGAYTNEFRELVQDPAHVTALAAEPGARIEVKGGLGDIEGIDVEGVLRAV